MREPEALYFIVKVGVYEHGTFWIGTDLEEGKKLVVELAEKDRDYYHEWKLRQYVDHSSLSSTDCDADNHILITSVQKYCAERAARQAEAQAWCDEVNGVFPAWTPLKK